MSHNRYVVLIVLLLTVLASSACNMPRRDVTPTETGVAILYTAAAQTVAAQLTQVNQPPVTPAGNTPVATAIPTSTLAPSETAPIPTVAPPTATPQPTNTPVPCDLVKFVKDVTYPDNTEVAPGETFVKTWRLQNVGTCTWTTGYSLVFTGGDAMGAPAAISLSGNVAPGQTVDVSVTLTAPDSSGTYRDDFMLRNANNVIFGLEDGAKPFWVQIKVKVKTGLLYDFLVQASSAAWKSGVGETADLDLAFGGDDHDVNGVAKIKDAVKLETGATSGKILLTFPKHENDGIIQGLFPAYTVQSGDRLRAKLGFMMNPGDVCGAGKVVFQIRYQEEGGSLETLKEWTKTCTGSFLDVNLDLSALKGKTVNFAFVVKADGSFQDDWAIWNSPRIEQ